MNSVATLTDLAPAQRLELMKLARARKLVGNRSELPPIEPAAREGRLPLSFAQERLWFIDRLDPGSAAYNIPVAWRLGGALDEAALERSLGEIVRRHEALRTVFAEADGSPVQVIAPFGGFALPVEDLSGLGEADREAAVRRRIGEEAARPFDLAAGPLFRAVLLRLGAEEHVLSLCMHHVVGDAWSSGVLFRELSALYEAYRDGRESPLAELPVQYADYAVWQREQLEGEVLDRQLAYWRERLAGAPELLELATDHPRPAVQTFRGAHERIECPGELLERLQALGWSEGATLYMVLLAAFQVLLSKYSGSEDIVVGSPIAGRTRKEVEELIGFFVNTLVLRTDLSGDPSFREVLRRARAVTLGAYEHQEVPFERLVAELQPERSLSHSPLFQVMFTLQNADREGALAGLSVSGVDAEPASAKFDLFLVLTATAQGLRGGLIYSTDLFERGTVERMLGHLERVLEQVAADADVPLSALELFGADERRLVLHEWNDNAQAYPEGACIHTLFETQAERTPHLIAATHGDASLSYRELNERANRVAHHLAGLGVGPEVRVGIGLQRGLDMLASMLGVLKAGGAYVPLDPAYPADRIAFTLRDSSVQVLVTQEKLRGLLPVQPGVRVVSVDGDAAPEIAAADPANLVGRADSRGLAYLIYTSGSTGVPKGVAIQHESAVVLLAWAAGVYSAEEMSGVLAATSISFDLSVYELFLPLSLGGRAIIVENALALADAPARDEVRLVNTVPSAAAALLKNDAVPAGVRTVNLAGEPLRAELVDALYERGVERVYDLYGPSEDTTYSTYTLRAAGGPETIGRPIANTQAYVLDSAMRPLPASVVGELYLGGRGLARGYLGRPALTAEKFVPDPFADRTGGRLYRTGDKARWKADGTLEYLGRLDAQVKVRGFRIELGEIESVLRVHAAVSDCVVVVREDAPGEKRLVAYVAGEVAVDEVREHLRGRLPAHMLPGAIVRLDALPLTPNGKLDRKALPAPELGSAEEKYVAPRTPVEEVLAGIWAEVLGIERVGVEESFFGLGGHSLLATRVVSRVREVFGVELPLRALFEGPTVAELAGRVEEMRRAGLPVLPAVMPVERTGALPLSFAQERLWFIDRLEPGSAVFNIPMAWRMGGALDEAALERSLSEIVRRHEALRTVFAEADGSPVQVIAPFGGFALPVEDLSGLGEADREAAVGRRAGEEAGRAFDLAAGPLFRAALLRLGDEDHVLLLSMHHIVSDGWSMGVLRRELWALYEAYREGGESPLHELPVQYADYAVWQREQLEGEVLDGQLAYWRERLAGAPGLLELPTDHPRPAVRTHRGATASAEFSGEVLQRLRALGRSEGATLYMTLLAAFQVLLSKYAGSEDVVVGSSIAGRTRREVEELIGFFVNALVLRTDLSGDPSFREVLRRVRGVTLGAYEHQEVPFERLVAELQPERSLSHSPLFQVSFALHTPEGSGAGLPGLRIEPAYADSETAKFDLSMAFVEGAQGDLQAVLSYSTDLFDEGTIRRMLGHLEQVLEQVAANAELPLSGLRLPGAEERHRMVVEWNRTEVEYPAGLCIHQLFEAQAERTPGAEAIIFEGERLTYAELNARANRLAHHLRSLGVGPEVRVGICVERSLEMVIGLLALLKAGGAYVALDPEHPDERLRTMLDDARPAVLLADASLSGRFAATGVPVVAVDADAPLWAGRPETNPEGVGVGPEHLVYVIYTSGSTGKPKGVMNVHRNVVNRVAGIQERWRLEAGESVLQNASLTFDVSAYEIFWPLMTGGRVVMTRPDGHRDPSYLVETIRSHGIGTASFVPSMLQLFLEHPEVESCGSLVRVPCGGEALPVALVRRLHERLPRATLYNRYGPSEAATAVTGPVRVADEANASAPIGRPMPNARAYLLDRAGEPVPVGVAGELCIGGAGVGRGYLERPGLTAERFVPDPFGDEPGARLYRTGDLARWLADGRIEFLGRNDFQVKIRGFRIEPGEVEAALLSHAGVREARVMAREDRPGERRLVAYVVGGAETGELRAHVRQSLPEYMVPSAFVVLEALPLTPNGKLDRDALPAPEYGAAEETYVAPRTPVEEVLAGIWAEVLRLERVGVEESFFELGGHSLLATRVVSRIRAVFGVELPLRALFEGPTVAEAAVRVEEMRRADLPVLPPVVPVGRTGALPLSFAQERLWFIDQLEPGSSTYNIPMAWRLGGALDQAALERSLGEIVRRHEALRTVFAEVDGSPVQVIAPFGGFALPVEDLSGLGEADREAEVRRRAAAEVARGFDLSRGPLFRAALLRLGEEDHVLLLSMHHVVSDGWSIGVFFRELSALYEAYRGGRESPLRELPVQYADYAVWQREQLEGEVLERQLSYWRERLAGAPELLELPADRPRPPVQTYRGALVPVELSLELLERLQALGRSEGATLYMVLLGAFQVLLSKYSGSDDIVVGSPIAGRTRAEVEELIGFFINTLVLRTDLSGDPGFRDVLRQVRQVTLGAYEHQEVPFEKLVAELQPERSLSHAPLFQVMFTLQNAEGRGDALAGLQVSGAGAAMEIAKFDLSLTLSTTAQGLRGALNYNTDLFERGTAERMLGHLERVLEQVAADADVRLSRLELLGEAERALVVEEWNRTEAEYPADLCIHELFEAQAARTPRAVAAVYQGEALSYAELNARANQLAHYLRRLGVGPEVRVGICLERSLELVVSLLAVLKAGGAYVPLDPGYPAERLRMVAADAGLALLLTAESLRDAVPAPAGLRVVSVDAPWSDIAAERTANPESAAGPDTLAYVIYTSGSTGTPKGVAMAHASVVSHVGWFIREFQVGPRDRVLQKTPISFDASVWEFYVPLLAGARLVMAAPGLEREPRPLARTLREQGITQLQVVPSLLRVLADEPELRECGALRLLFCGGEALAGELARRAGELLPAARVVNLYGPTECCIQACTHAIAGEDGGLAFVPIGRPVANTRAYVLGPALQPAAPGIPGELYLGGVQVARCYLGRPGLTAERFVPDPFSTEGGARLYRTGDRARWRADGAIEYLGRRDEQVKVRGFRIEPGEIEAVLRRHESVADCVVMARSEAGEKRLVAYIVGDAEAEALRAHVRQSLPEHMVPAAFLSLDALPLAPNGKLDRAALPVPEYGPAGERYVAPRTPVEEVLAGVWAEVLRLERVGAEDGFFELGGHSLLAIRVVSRVREALGVEVPLRALFEAPTVAQLAVRVEALRRVDLPLLPPIAPADRTRPLPLSFAQERLWFLDRLQPDSASYNVPAPLRLNGLLDPGALERSLSEIVRRHEALRTTFPERDGAPVQVVAPVQGFSFPIRDLSALDREEREAEVRRLALDDAGTPFDLAAGPLFRAGLLRLGDEEHVLLLSMHHVVSDAWSRDVLLRELAALYGAYRDGGESPLPELPVQYADYAAWQREHLHGPALEAQLAWWKGRLAGAPALLELPTDRPRPAVQGHEGAYEVLRIPGELLGRLEKLGRGEGATLFMVLLGAFQVLLGRYSGSEDVVVGSPIAGRGRREVEDLIGFFLNTLALRTELGGDPSFREVLKRVREMTLGAFEHQEVPFERLVEELQPERSLSHSPLFQVMFVLQEADRQQAGLPGLEVLPLNANAGTSKFDLTLGMWANAGGLVGSLEYRTDLFDRATIARMLAHFERLLEQVAADADVPLSRLRLIAEDERRLVVQEWNATDAGQPAAPVHALFEAQADRSPDAVAVTHGDMSLTYRELDDRANRLAHHLAALGVGVDGRVGLSMERGPEMMVALLGILKAGAAYVPLDPAYPADRLAYMLENSAARVLVTQQGVAGKLPAGDAVVVRVDADAQAIARQGAERLALPVAPENLAYVIYTSGSTGRPKGVAMPHGALANLLAWQERDWNSPAPAVTLQFTSISFDVSFQEIFSCWTAGGRLVLLDEEHRYDSAGLLEIAERERVERLFMPAVALHQLAEAGDERGLAPSSLREVVTAGEQLRVTEAMRRWMGALGTPLYNHYGPSETHVVTRLALDGDPASWPLLPSIGGPIANTRTYLLDAALQPSPVGVPGDLYLGGAGLARGYLNQPALTAGRFVPDPFAATPGARVYRTGDRARWLADGTIEFLGRADEQVKIRGFRIEPGEVEAVIATHPGVRKAVVVAREDVPGDRRLVAYVVADGVVDVAELRSRVKGRLPEYMVPAAFVPLDALPLTPSGKVARRALPAPEYTGTEDRYVAPRTPLEEVLAGIWAEVLRLERVGVEESFFELGGHSLLATRVVSRVRAVFSVELPLRALFEGPTVAELAVRVEELRRAGLPALPPVVPTERTGALPLSFAQERLWFIDRMEPGSAAYNIPVAWRLGGALDEAALERSLGEVVRRHEALRTVFTEVDGSPVQVIAPFGGFALPVEDLSGLSEAALRRRAGEEARRAFDLSAGPLFRAALLRLGAEDHVLLLSMHHIVSDGWSMGVFSRELSSLYEAYREGRESPLAELPVQYADYAVWQREQLEGEALDRQLAYWKERLAGAPELLELPTDHPRPAVQAYRGASVPVNFSLELLERLQALGRSEGTTLYMTLLGAFQVLLSKYSGSEDVVVGSPIAGRTRKEVEELIGFFVNTLVLRTGLSGDPSFREVLRRAREVTLGAYEHQEVPFERLVAELQPERSMSHSPLFQVMFTLQNAGGGGVALPGLEVSGVGAELASAKFDLSLTLTATAQGLRGGLNYSTDLFERGTVERMLGHLERVLEQVAADADLPLSRIGLLDGAERAEVVEACNATERAYPAVPVHALFAEQARRTPHAPALLHGGRKMTYAALDRRAEVLARRLRALGVGPETRVGVCAERTPELLAAVLGIWKAGGAYLPLDPDYPAERLAWMVSDARLPVVVTAGSAADALPQGEATVVRADLLADDGGEASPVASGVSVDNLAYVIYTSGSTGRPKGVGVQHGSLANLLAATRQAFGVREGDVMPALASYSFDIWLFETLLPLTSGAAVRLLDRERVLDVPSLLDEAGDATLLHAVPALMRQVARVQRESGRPTRLRRLFVGGDRVPADLPAEMADAFPGAETHVLYGPTEGTILASAHAVPADGQVAGHPIGTPFGNVRLYVCDPPGNPQPAGLPGELRIGGPGVARGYLGRPALTAERFVPDPFGPAGSRLYRTGDRVRRGGDGSLEYLGRLDTQVKVRGFRVEPGEIEAALRRHPGVRECVVVVRGDAPGEGRLVAYVAGEAGAEALKQHLRRDLPDYMVPSALVVLDALPTTPNGKLDRRALPAPDYASAAERYVAPRTGTEELLVEIWMEMLRLERVGVHDGFFELGGHSLLATRVVSRVRAAFGVELPLRTIFETPTVAGVAAQVESLVLARVEGPELLDALARLEQMSEDEVMALLGGD